MTQPLKILAGRHDRFLIITKPGELNGHVQLRLPEFHGVSDSRPFAIEQAFRWEIHAEGPVEHGTFEIEGLPSELGIDFSGSVESDGQQLVKVSLAVRNEQPSAIHDAFQTVILDLSNAPDFQESSGESTFIATGNRWMSIAEFRALMNADFSTIMVGGSKDGQPDIGAVIARQDIRQDLVIGACFPSAHALATNHPDWPSGLLLSLGWGSLQSGKPRETHGFVFVTRGGIEKATALVEKIWNEQI